MNPSLNPSNSRVLNRRQFLQITAAMTAVSGVYLLKKQWPGQPLAAFNETRTLMGTVINLALIGADENAARRAIAATFGEMERLISLFDHRQPQSQLAQLNQTGQLAAPSPELVEIITRAQQYSRLTDGAFDISVKPLVDAYQAGLPDAAAYQALVDYRQIQAGDRQITLARPGMSLTLDGIAKGRVVDGAAAMLQTQGFDNILVEAGGDLMGLGARIDGAPWRVGISHPRLANAGVLRVLPVAMQAVATSGDYMHSFSQDFTRHHIIDPRTGFSPTDLASVTVLAPSATDADALSTAVMVLGSDAGLALAARLPHVEALVITKEMEVRQTAGFPTLGDGRLESR